MLQLSLITCAYLYTLYTCRSLSGLHVTVISTLPFGAGLGSSAAYSVCLSAAFLQAMAAKTSTKTHTNISTQQEQSAASPATNTSAQTPVSGGDESVLECGSIPEEIQRRLEKEADVELRSLGIKGWSQQGLFNSANEWGFKAEKIIHGTPSGIDNSISTFGTIVLSCTCMLAVMQCAESFTSLGILLLLHNLLCNPYRWSNTLSRWKHYPLRKVSYTKIIVFEGGVSCTLYY